MKPNFPNCCRDMLNLFFIHHKEVLLCKKLETEKKLGGTLASQCTITFSRLLLYSSLCFKASLIFLTGAKCNWYSTVHRGKYLENIRCVAFAWKREYLLVYHAELHTVCHKNSLYCTYKKNMIQLATTYITPELQFLPRNE